MGYIALFPTHPILYIFLLYLIDKNILLKYNIHNTKERMMIVSQVNSEMVCKTFKHEKYGTLRIAIMMEYIFRWG